MSAQRRASDKKPVYLLFLLLALWPGIAPAIEVDSITDNPDWEMSTWSLYYTDGLEAAKKKDWEVASYNFKQAFYIQRGNGPRIRKYADAPQLWYNLALTLTRFPGYEVRAAALFSAYLVKYPHSPQRGAILKQIDQLLSKLDARIELLRKEEDRQFRNIWKTDSIKTPEEEEMGGAVIARRFADQGELAMAERHAARFEAWLEKNRVRLENHNNGSFEWTEILGAQIALYDSLINAYVLRYNRNLAGGRNIDTDLIKARAYYDKTVGSYRGSVEKYRQNWILFTGASTRFMACDGRRNGYDISMETMKNNISRYAISDRIRDSEMVRFGIVEYQLGDYASAEKTFGLIKDGVLRNKWLKAAKDKTRLTASEILGGFRHTASPILSGFRHTDWDSRSVDTDKIPIVVFRREATGIETVENQTIACLDSDLEKERLLNLASMGIDLLACSVIISERKLGDPTLISYSAGGKKNKGYVPASDLNVEQCLNDLTQPEFEPAYGAEAYPKAIGIIADSLSRGKRLLQRYSEMYEAFPDAN